MTHTTPEAASTMAGNTHKVEPYQRKDGRWAWRITVGGDIIATDGGQGYENKQDCLTALFGIWFGTWDTSFLALYEEWTREGYSYEVPPEAQEGVPVHIPQSNSTPAIDADAPHYEVPDDTVDDVKVVPDKNDGS